jgi:hypothetical protein
MHAVERKVVVSSAEKAATPSKEEVVMPWRPPPHRRRRRPPVVGAGRGRTVEKGPPAAVECGRIRDGLRRSPNATMDGSEERGGGWRCRSSFWHRSMRKEGMR